MSTNFIPCHGHIKISKKGKGTNKVLNGGNQRITGPSVREVDRTLASNERIVLAPVRNERHGFLEFIAHTKWQHTSDSP